MTEVVDADELLRRMQRSRARAVQELRGCRERGEALRSRDPDAARDAELRGMAYEVVLSVLDEILTPGRDRGGAGAS
ncbi:hypothetical protein [Streptomyces sp. enrichment culture]|uniref:hypothetical protein n=1 Tax=Streptomyces sp. enrichment culture TaxID=1795815 RepID=UPI003F55AC3D